jgi:hypothetical protein
MSLTHSRRQRRRSSRPDRFWGGDGNRRCRDSHGGFGTDRRPDGRRGLARRKRLLRGTRAAPDRLLQAGLPVQHLVHPMPKPEQNNQSHDRRHH